MVAEIRIYYEGDKALKKGFSLFFKSVKETMRQNNLRFQLIYGRSRENTLWDFFRALHDHLHANIILLIDAEGPIQEARNRLKDRRDWRDSGAGEDQAHFMTQCMEAWFVADAAALRTYYGQQFNEKSLPQNPDVESVPKEDILTGLASATRNTQKGRYHKTRHAPDILQGLDVTVVRQKAPQCNRLFQKLEELTAGNS